MDSASSGLRLFAKACEHHQRQELSEAESLYRESVQRDPSLVDAYRNLGSMLRQMGRPEEGLVCQEKAVALQPRDPGLLGNLGNVLRDLGRLDEARSAFEKATEIAPNEIGPHLGLAITLNALKQHERLITELEPFIEKIDSNEKKNEASELILEIGNAYHCLGNEKQALILWEEARIHSQGEKQLAMVLNTAQVLCSKQNHAEAENILKPYLKHFPAQPNLIYAIGVTVRGQGRWEEACELFTKALEHDPNYAICLNTYGLLLREMGQVHQSRNCFEKALKIDKNFGAAMNNLGSVLKDIAQYEDALKWLRQGAMQLGHNAAAYSNVLFTLVGYELEPALERYEEACRFGKKFSNARYERWRDSVLSPNSEKELRIGFISPDFCRHAVSYFIEPLLEQWKQSSLNITLYAAGTVRDDYTDRLKEKVNHWREIQHANDEQVVQQIRQDEIDILIDLAGHTAGNRLPIFTHKPAPIQATYLGYYGTTGLNQIDYWISDYTLHPDNLIQNDLSSESHWRLPRTYVSYRPLDESPEVAPLPLLERKIPMFGSFNQSRKITQKTASNWMKVLTKIPRAHLYLKSKNLGEESEANRIRKLFEELGLDEDRLHLEGHSPNVATHLDRYRNIDIALDTYPYTGCTTTADALWMGVPVLTVAGKSMVSRQAAAVVMGAGHAEWICLDSDDMANKAQDLLRDINKLKELRRSLRSELKKSELLNHGELAICLENTFREWWGKLLIEENLISDSSNKNNGWPLRSIIKTDATFSPIPR
tara:strand:+ start:2059 stop:4362 length:2304 start_codon:yes stop_codon:yes gene_type:complete